MSTEIMFISRNCPPEHLQPFFSDMGHTDLQSPAPSFTSIALTGKFPSNLPVWLTRSFCSATATSTQQQIQSSWRSSQLSSFTGSNRPLLCGLTPTKNDHHLNTESARSTVIKEHVFILTHLGKWWSPSQILKSDLGDCAHFFTCQFKAVRYRRQTGKPSVMAQMVSHQHLTTETWVQSHASQRGICGGNSGIKTVFLQVLWLCPVSIIPSEGTLRNEL